MGYSVVDRSCGPRPSLVPRPSLSTVMTGDRIAVTTAAIGARTAAMTVAPAGRHLTHA